MTTEHLLGVKTFPVEENCSKSLILGLTERACASPPAARRRACMSAHAGINALIYIISQKRIRFRYSEQN